MVSQRISTTEREHWDIRDLSFRLEQIIACMSKDKQLSPYLPVVLSFVSGSTEQSDLDCMVAACQRRCGKSPSVSSASKPVGLFEAIPHILLQRASKSLIEFHDRLTGENLVGFYALVWTVTIIEALIDGDSRKVDDLANMSEQVCGDVRPILNFIQKITYESQQIPKVNGAEKSSYCDAVSFSNLAYGV